MILGGRQPIDTDGLTEDEIKHLFNHPRAWAKGRPPTDRELLDSKLDLARPREDDAVDVVLRKAAALVRQAEELQAAILALTKRKP